MTGLKAVLGLGMALIAGGFLIVQAEASPLTRAADSLAVLKTYRSCIRPGVCSAPPAARKAPNGSAPKPRRQPA